MSIRPKIGDVFEIPLPDGRRAYCQYMLYSAELGFMIRVFDLLTEGPITEIDSLAGQKLLFPPVFVGLQATARSSRWKRIGNFDPGQVEHPRFRQAMGTRPGTYYDWRIWDGKRTKKIGCLPPELRSLELACVWGDEGLEERIIEGTYRGDKMY